MEEESLSKIVVFDGSPAKWREWSKKFQARARIAKLSKALNGTMQVLREDVDENLLNAEEKAARKANDMTYNLLILSTEGSAFSCVERATTEALPIGDAELA